MVPRFQLLRALVTTAVAFSWAGCAGLSQSQFGPPTDIAADAISPVAFAGALPDDTPSGGLSWMSPDTKRSLLYVTNWGGNTVTVYTYRNGKSLAQVGTLTGFSSPGQPCVDKARNVYIPQYGRKQVAIYAHGGTSPIGQLILRSPGRPHATGCSVDRKNGNVAVAVFKQGSKSGSVQVFAPHKHKPVEYRVSNVTFPEFVAYDNHGNLFADGKDAHGVFALAELANNAKSFSALTVNGATIYVAGQVLWGGTHLLVGDQNYRNAGKGSAIYQLSVSGSSATVRKVVVLPGTSTVVGFWKRGRNKASKVTTADFGGSAAPLFKFPSGAPFATITKGVSKPFGVTISP